MAAPDSKVAPLLSELVRSVSIQCIFKLFTALRSYLFFRVMFLILFTTMVNHHEKIIWGPISGTIFCILQPS